jgi:DNA invertase Pin-like site-specific DNA recombinase
VLYGYARVSSLDQDLSIQLDALTAAGCTVVRSEKVTGTSTDGREELATLLQFLREGDTLVVTRIDRLARSLRDLQNIVHDLRQRGVTLKATEQPIDTLPLRGSVSWTCSGCSRNSKPTCVASARWRGLQGRRRTGSTLGRAVTRH